MSVCAQRRVYVHAKSMCVKAQRRRAILCTFIVSVQAMVGTQESAQKTRRGHDRYAVARLIFPPPSLLFNSLLLSQLLYSRQEIDENNRSP